ncbi:hypothetical protein HKO46_08450 [Streptococcus equi subsp. zooepidemicus]|uniref:hypothetical protein n=1 Tax=Streptococcus equi TaxID=1336 RepID=UPI00021745D2|nr:hypothetical protein [Streptococcus equi]AEJ24324.1 exported protein [Streptococcus equi subsp. zooepidemicus ATCC 35246]AIA68954.1 hypothetical protein Q426_08760 [Streptococcus equi subsp. zooepidemicus CY]KIQ75484.1 hypothetical protein QQ41_07545 [Streptococcus equi subsp. zooepidemicus]KIS16465.1 hypothetical protein AT48_00322 [Streptococcus equi subsp. zooepidemicus SzAM60]MBR7753916.1 hypothetical protein [Streptococcus equi subsp. zooepidemicus]
MRLKKLIYSSIAALAILTYGTISANADASIPEIDQTEVITILKSDGYLNIDEGTQEVTITEKYKQAVLSSIDLDRQEAIFTENSVTIRDIFSPRSFTGVNKIVFTWKGYDLYLDSTNANRLSALGWGSAIVSKVLAAALGVVSASISYANAAGRGVIVAFVGTFPRDVIHWVASQ